MQGIRSFVVTYLVVLMLAVPATVPASESCSMLGGKCRDACGKNEKAEAGDFEDCGAKQEVLCGIRGDTQPMLRCIAGCEELRTGQLRAAGERRLSKGFGKPGALPEVEDVRGPELNVRGQRTALAV